MGIIIDTQAKKSWLTVKYSTNNTPNLGATFNIIFTKAKFKNYGYCKVFTFKDKLLKGKNFLIAIEGDEYHELVKKYFGTLEEAFPPAREQLIRVCGATIEHDWMFSASND